MTKNKLTDLNDHLFMQLERLSNEDMPADKIDAEVKRGKAIVAVADQIVKAAALQVQVAKLVAEKGNIRPLLPTTATVADQRPQLIEAKK